MKRDGFCESLWQIMPDYESATTTAAHAAYDVIIVGGGITGMTAGLRLQQSGLSCLLLEAQNIGFGTTGGTTAHLNTFFDTPYYLMEQNFGKEAPVLVAKGAKEAIRFIKEQVQQLGVEGYKEAPAYIIAENAEQEDELNSIMAAANGVGAAMQYVSSFPYNMPFTKLVKTEMQASFHPALYLYALAKKFEQLGGVIKQHCRVTDVSAAANDQLTIKTTSGDFHSRHAIYATHIPPGVNILHTRCAPYRSYAIAVTLKDGNYPQDLIYDLQDPYHYYRSQEINGQMYLIAGGEDHKTGHETNTEARFRSLEGYVGKFFNIDKVIHRWSSQYYEPNDGLPYIGHLPGGPKQLLVATGFGGNGMIYGTLSGLILSDRIRTGISEYTDLFDPGRMKPVAGFRNFIKENTDVVGQLVSGIFPAEELPELADIAPGEGRVITWQNAQLAVFKDEQHQLHIVSPDCPHLHCSVKWNSAERTWDCPCHGSRFSVDGEMFTAPASADLTKVNRVKD